MRRAVRLVCAIMPHFEGSCRRLADSMIVFGSSRGGRGGANATLEHICTEHGHDSEGRGSEGVEQSRTMLELFPYPEPLRYGTSVPPHPVTFSPTGLWTTVLAKASASHIRPRRNNLVFLRSPFHAPRLVRVRREVSGNLP